MAGKTKSKTKDIIIAPKEQASNTSNKASKTKPRKKNDTEQASKVKSKATGKRSIVDLVTTSSKSTTSQSRAKKRKLIEEPVEIQWPSNAGSVLVVGEGDTGQLGLGPDIMDRSRPSRVTLSESVVQVCAGGMHSVCLTQSGHVYTFGCNDEGALGRLVADEDECMSPGKVDIKEKIVMLSAGDSHTAALSIQGNVYIWGTFRDSNGPIGILPGQGKIETPQQIMAGHKTVKIASGYDHLVCLTRDGQIYTLGSAEQGQLGRVAECFAIRGGRRGVEHLLTPALVSCKKRKTRFSNIWSGSYVTFAKDKATHEIYSWGLNNYYQLGISDMKNKFTPEKCPSFDSTKDWIAISGGQHHTLALDSSGKVYSLGRKEYGRLGLGEEGLEEKSAPTLIPKLLNVKCVDVNGGSCVSYAVSDDGTIFGWGMGSTKQLGQGDEEEDIYEPIALGGKQLDNKKGLMVSGGGQHTIFLAQDRS